MRPRPCLHCDCGDPDKEPAAPPTGGLSLGLHLIQHPDSGMTPPAFMPLPSTSRLHSFGMLDRFHTLVSSHFKPGSPVRSGYIACNKTPVRHVDRIVVTVFAYRSLRV